jgi:PAS domain S-box-containing protein
MRQRSESRSACQFPVSLLLFEVSFIVAYYVETASAQNGIAPFRFADAALLCGLLLSAPRDWWLYVLATVPIRFFLFVPSGTALWFLFAGLATDSLKALFSAWLLRRVSRDHAWFDNLHEFGRYFLVTGVLAPGLSAFACGVSHAPLRHSFWTSYAICFFGASLAGLVFAPFILLVLNHKRFGIENLRYFEALLAAPGLGSAIFIALYLQSYQASLLSMQFSLFVISVPLMFVSVMIYQLGTKLKESEERFRTLVDVAPVMLWMAGADGRCTFFNKPWLDFTGLSLKEQVEQDWVLRVHPEDRERCVIRYLSAFKSRENFSLEYRLLRSDGVYRWVFHDGKPRYANDGTFAGYVGSRIDFTDRREAEERLRELSSRLLNAQEIEGFRIGYELGEDVAQKLYALSIRLSFFSPDYKGNYKLRTGLKGLDQQLRDVSRDVVRLSNQLRPTPEAVILSAALRNLCLQATDHKRAVVFVQNEEVSPLPENVCVTLYRVTEESLRNALTHSGATHIKVELSSSATEVQISVKDNGCGFVVGFNTRLGLGLSGMSERMRSSGGAFSVISNPGEGTTVIATIPLIRAMKAGRAV